MSAHTYACKLKHGPAKQAFCEKLMRFIEDGTAINIKDLKINGDVLKGLGLNGKAIGNFLNTARNDCLGQPELNDPDKLLKRAQKYVEKREARHQAAEAAAALRKGKGSDGLSII